MNGWESAFFVACMAGPTLAYLVKVALEERRKGKRQVEE